MDEIREAIREKQQQMEALENAKGSQDKIDKLKNEIRSLETEHQKARQIFGKFSSKKRSIRQH